MSLDSEEFSLCLTFLKVAFHKTSKTEEDVSIEKYILTLWASYLCYSGAILSLGMNH